MMHCDRSSDVAAATWAGSGCAATGERAHQVATVIAVKGQLSLATGSSQEAQSDQLRAMNSCKPEAGEPLIHVSCMLEQISICEFVWAMQLHAPLLYGL